MGKDGQVKNEVSVEELKKEYLEKKRRSTEEPIVNTVLTKEEPLTTFSCEMLVNTVPYRVHSKRFQDRVEFFIPKTNFQYTLTSDNFDNGLSVIQNTIVDIGHPTNEASGEGYFPNKTVLGLFYQKCQKSILSRQK